VIAGQQHPLIPTEESKVPTGVTRTDLKAQALRFPPEQRRAPKGFKLVTVRVLDDHPGEPLQRAFEFAPQGQSQAAGGRSAMQVGHSGAIEVELADLRTWMDHRPVTQDEIRSIVDCWSECQDGILT
jgi:hypothetical protein